MFVTARSITRSLWFQGGRRGPRQMSDWLDRYYKMQSLKMLTRGVRPLRNGISVPRLQLAGIPRNASGCLLLNPRIPLQTNTARRNDISRDEDFGAVAPTFTPVPKPRTLSRTETFQTLHTDPEVVHHTSRQHFHPSKK
jgi:hypothetical protein